MDGITVEMMVRTATLNMECCGYVQTNLIDIIVFII